MIVTDIKQQVKNENRFSVFVDGKYTLSLSTDDILEQGIKLKLELDQSQINKLLKLSSDSLLLGKTYDKCLRRPHSIKEIRDYLYKRGAGEELSEMIIEKCQQKHLLNDQLFAEKWHEHRKRANKSNHFIRGELLMKKGVDKAIVDVVVKDDDQSALRAAIEKRRNRYDDQQKLISYLQRQGFSYYDIKKQLDIIEEEA